MNHTEYVPTIRRAVQSLSQEDAEMILGDLASCIVEPIDGMIQLKNSLNHNGNTPPIWYSLRPLKEALTAAGLTVQEPS